MELQDLFKEITQNKKQQGVLNTKKLMSRIRKQNALFDNDDHHDAHEFLSWMLNDIHENIIADAKELG
jgi:ubiquitin carboxyl-terminal hydrolase 9/13